VGTEEKGGEKDVMSIQWREGRGSIMC